MNEVIYFHLKVIQAYNNIEALEEQGAVLEINGSVLDKLKEAGKLIQEAKNELVDIENGNID